MAEYYIYILSNDSRILYSGMTNDLPRRIFEHKNELVEGFSKKYKLKELVYFEMTTNVNSVITREKQLKNWHRDWKINLIESKNPNWLDLSIELGIDAETSSA